MSARVLYLDLETRPLELYGWGLFNQNFGINQIKNPDGVISFASKWRGGRSTDFFSVHHHGKEEMVQRAWDALDKCHILVTWNGKRFDEPWLKREFIQAGLTPPSPFKHLDLFQTAKRQFRFPSNKLDYVSQALGLTGKVSTGGFDLWLKCMAGDDKAWAKMRTYNKRDVTVLEELHERMLPYIKGHPHMGLYEDGERDCCQNCASEDLQRRGFAYTPLGVYQQYRCNPCGTWSRGKKAVQTADVRGVQ